jgi:hypothetical protein
MTEEYEGVGLGYVQDNAKSDSRIGRKTKSCPMNYHSVINKMKRAGKLFILPARRV